MLSPKFEDQNRTLHEHWSRGLLVEGIPNFLARVLIPNHLVRRDFAWVMKGFIEENMYIFCQDGQTHSSWPQHAGSDEIGPYAVVRLSFTHEFTILWLSVLYSRDMTLHTSPTIGIGEVVQICIYSTTSSFYSFFIGQSSMMSRSYTSKLYLLVQKQRNIIDGSQ